jgi:sarcosine oxidase, subunit alpha
VTSRRLASGGVSIDRDRGISFTFEGRDLGGFAGDTLASALLANGVDVVCPSPILGRPRGVFSAGVEEPCGFVEIIGPRFEPIVPATTVKLVDHMSVRGRPGVGRLPSDAAGAIASDHRHLHVETIVIGAGIAGLRAAVGAASAGDRVLLVDERHWLGGTAAGDEVVDGEPALAWIASVGGELAHAPEVRVLTEATAIGLYDDGYVVVVDRSAPITRVWHVRAARVVVAAGAHERPIAFADDDRPGVMLASAARTYADRFGVLVGSRAVVFANNHSGHDIAVDLAARGLDVAAVVDVGPPGPGSARARAAGIDVRNGWAVTGTDGDPRVSRVHAAGPGGAVSTFEADLLLVAGGWNPAVQLWRGINGGLRYDEPHACFVPDGTGPSWLEIAGAAAGEGLPEVTPFWFTPGEDLGRHFVDHQRDATVADVLDAVGRDLRSTEHVKRATYIGTGIDQGRTSGVLTAAIVNQAWGTGPGAQGPTNARPPYTPVPFSVLAGRDRGPRLLDPVRLTPIHPWHADHGAVFENVGQWRRPWYFPRTGEGLHDAVERECRAVRERLGVMDASTLGKIELTGPDTARFLDRLYTNRMSTLRVGSVRYGLMLSLDGMVFDDGVVMRLAEDRSLISTTTGGAAKVLDHVEEWLQTEWPELRVYATSVSEQWATVAVNGPRARDLLVGLGTDIDLAPEAFPFMTWRDGEVAGMSARVARVSFSGELAYEINVAGRSGLAMWEAVTRAGAPLGIQAYGTEAMHRLRAEKGYVIVGQDTDGTVTPHDLGMSWIVRKDDTDFIGRRSLRRPDTMRPDRKQLVGLRPLDPEAWLPEGAQLVEPGSASDPPPVAMLGFVTSSYPRYATSPSFALALVREGRERIGTRVVAPWPGGPIEAEVTPPTSYDPEGARRDG